MERGDECGAGRREGWEVGRSEEREAGGGDCGWLAEEEGGETV